MTKEEIYKEVEKDLLIHFDAKVLMPMYERLAAIVIDSTIKALNIASVVVTEGELFCRDCKYDKAETHHDKMWCRDCRQKDRFKAK